MKAVSATVRQHSPFAGFLVVGSVSMLCNVGSRYGFQQFSSYEMALVGANTVGVLSAFFLNRWFVFKPGNAARPCTIKASRRTCGCCTKLEPSTAPHQLLAAAMLLGQQHVMSCKTQVERSAIDVQVLVKKCRASR